MKDLRSRIRDLLARVGLLRVIRQSALWRFKNRKLYRDFQKNAIDVFWLVDSILKENDIEAWPDFGTLLGIVREGGPIKHDLDLDFALINSKSTQQTIRTSMQQAGFKLLTESILRESNTIIEEKYFISGIEVDFFYLVENGDKLIAYDLETDSGKSIEEEASEISMIRPYRNTLSRFELKSYLFQGKAINVPRNLEQHLTELYGEDYLVPNPRWKNNMRKDRVFSPTESIDLRNYRDS